MPLMTGKRNQKNGNATMHGLVLPPCSTSIVLRYFLEMVPNAWFREGRIGQDVGFARALASLPANTLFPHTYT